MLNQEAGQTIYYSWEGDACRIHKDTQGNLTADIYRGGVGEVSVNASDVLYNGRKISEAKYKELVIEEIQFCKTTGSK